MAMGIERMKHLHNFSLPWDLKWVMLIVGDEWDELAVGFEVVEQRSLRDEAKGGVLKNVLMAKVKEGTSESQIEQLIQSYANLVNLVDPMKPFHWGKELSIAKQEEGYTRVFETTFESVEGMAQYVAHPAHHDFVKLFLPNLEIMCFIAAPEQQVMRPSKTLPKYRLC
ncbi:unnamed protein product [Malus baccata var. baccata]